MARIRLDSGNLRDHSKGKFATTFLSSSPTTPATQSGLHQPLADDRRCYRRKGKKSPRTLRKTAGLSLRLLAGWGAKGQGECPAVPRGEMRAPENHVVVKHSADSGCVAHPVAKCREAPLLFSPLNLRSQDRRARRARWTLRLLENKVVELGIVDRATDSTIGCALKKTLFSPIAASTGSSRRRPTARS